MPAENPKKENCSPVYRELLLSTAYLPPAGYFSLIRNSDKILIESHENYHKQTYRNRCYILSSHGSQSLTVPVYSGTIHKTAIRDIRIDYSKRWQQVHLGALNAAYSSSPYYQYYIEDITRIISRKNEFLFDLNMELLQMLLKMLKLEKNISLSSDFTPIRNDENDFRYSISPKLKEQVSVREYRQVFNTDNRFVKPLSILDLIFNMGPESGEYLC